MSKKMEIGLWYLKDIYCGMSFHSPSHQMVYIHFIKPYSIKQICSSWWECILACFCFNKHGYPSENRLVIHVICAIRSLLWTYKKYLRMEDSTSGLIQNRSNVQLNRSNKIDPMFSPQHLLQNRWVFLEYQLRALKGYGPEMHWWNFTRDMQKV